MAVDPAGPEVWAHPFLRGVGQIAAAVADTAEAQPELMSTREKAEALVELAQLEARVAALKLRVLACADDVAAADGARDAGAWLAHHLHLDRGPVRRDAELATAVGRWTRIGAALSSGAMNLAQARACVEVLEELPEDLDAALVEAVEDQLVVLAADWAPRDLKVLGRKVLEAIDPEVADAHEARKLEDEERAAWESSSVRVRRRGNGWTRLIIDQPDAIANRLLTYLDAFTSPRQRGTTTEAGPVHVQRGQAFGSLLELLDPDGLPVHGGDATTVIVTIGLDDLRSRLAAGHVIGHDLERISAGHARRLACNAELIPAVLGTKSEILDLGRSARLFSRAQRKALRLRDTRCRAEACDIPAAWTEAHHKDPWARGGPTDLDNGISLCSFHHHRCHDETYDHEYLPNGDVRYRRRT